MYKHWEKLFKKKKRTKTTWLHVYIFWTHGTALLAIRSVRLCWDLRMEAKSWSFQPQQNQPTNQPTNQPNNTNNTKNTTRQKGKKQKDSSESECRSFSPFASSLWMLVSDGGLDSFWSEFMWFGWLRMIYNSNSPHLTKYPFGLPADHDPCPLQVVSLVLALCKWSELPWLFPWAQKWRRCPSTVVSTSFSMIWPF